MISGNLANLKIAVDTSDLQNAAQKFSDLGNQIGGNIPGFNTAADVLSKVSSAASSVGSASAAAVIGVGALVSALGALGIALAFRFNDRVDELADLGEQFGYNAMQIAGMKAAAEGAGSSLEAVLTMSNRVARAMTKTGEENSKASEAFSRLGVDVDDASGKMRNQQEVTSDLITAWENSAKTAQDNADMQLLLGKSFEQQIPAFQQAAEMLEFVNQLHEEGIGISNAAVEAASANELANQKLALIFDAVGSELVSLVIPAFTTLTEWLIESYRTGGLVKMAFDLISGATSLLMVGVKGVISGFIILDGIANGLIKTLAGVAAAMKAVFSGNFAGAAAIGENVISDVNKVGQNTEAALKKLWSPPAATPGLAPLGRGNARPGGKALPKSTGGGGGGASKKDTSGDALAREEVQLLKMISDAEIGLIKITESKEQGILREVEALRKRFPEMEKHKKALLDTSLAEIQSLKIAEQKAKEDERSKKQIDGINQAIEEYNQTNQQMIENMSLGSRAGKENNEILAMQIKHKREIAALDEKEINHIQTKTALLAAQQQQMNALIAGQQARKQAEQDWSVGANQAMNKYVEDAGNHAKLAEQAFTNSFSAMEDALVQFTMTGKFNFKDLLKTILSEIVRFLAKQAVSSFIKVISGFFGGGGSSGGYDPWAGGGGYSDAGFAKGGAFGTGGIRLFADGGILGGPTMFGMNNGLGVAGEAGPEAIMPLSRGPNGKLGVYNFGGGGGGATIINNVVVNVESKSGNNDAENTEMGNRVAKAVNDSLKTLIKSEVSNYMRPGNMLNPSAPQMAFS